MMSGMLEREAANPLEMRLSSVALARVDAPVPKQETLKVLAVLLHHVHRRNTGTHQIPHRFVGFIRHPDRRQVAGSMKPRQLQSVATIVLDVNEV
jgi:hypothetical protein